MDIENKSNTDYQKRCLKKHKSLSFEGKPYTPKHPYGSSPDLFKCNFCGSLILGFGGMTTPWKGSDTNLDEIRYRI